MSASVGSVCLSGSLTLKNYCSNRLDVLHNNYKTTIIVILSDIAHSALNVGTLNYMLIKKLKQ